MVSRKNSDFDGGSSGARSRDLRIKRPQPKPTYLRAVIGAILGHKTGHAAHMRRDLVSRHFVTDSDRDKSLGHAFPLDPFALPITRLGCPS